MYEDWSNVHTHMLHFGPLDASLVSRVQKVIPSRIFEGLPGILLHTVCIDKQSFSMCPSKVFDIGLVAIFPQRRRLIKQLIIVRAETSTIYA
jgi:hypothetical protein